MNTYLDVHILFIHILGFEFSVNACKLIELHYMNTYLDIHALFIHILSYQRI